MFRELQAIAVRQRCGVGGTIRYYLGLALDRAKTAKEAADV
jgi:hypothetical protein